MLLKDIFRGKLISTVHEGSTAANKDSIYSLIIVV